MRFEFSIELGGEFQLSGLKAAAKSGGEQEKPEASTFCSDCGAAALL